MKAVVYDHYTEIFLNDEEIETHCKMGQGADCCIFLVVSGKGFECCYHNRSGIGDMLERARAGLTNARREGCDTVKNFDPSGKLGEVDIKYHEEE
ncbi:unnamed protein product [marine sediment metagenome]|uniref:Uncharacterized protein n=1 Tax=marine sediment metagenome TaxID=412755 RepID=X1DGN9_9ZZZZ